MTDRLFDVSHFNASTDFATAKAAGFVGVYLKATQGDGFTDPTFTARARSAHAAGLLVGAYLFFEPDRPVRAQVSLFARAVVTAGQDLFALRPALDHETSPAGMSAADIAAAATQAATALANVFGVAPLVYNDRAFISEGKCAGLEAFPLWIADYTPGATSPDLRGRTAYALWQTGQASVPGISGGDGPGTDVDVTPDVSALLFRSPAVTALVPAPPTEEDDMARERIILTTAAGPDHRGAALLGDGTLHATYLSSDQWALANHLAKVVPNSVIFAELSTKDHDAATGGPK